MYEDPREGIAPSSRRIARRSFLGGGALGLFCANWLRAAEVASSSRPKSVILIFNCGAPSHIDLWDPKPKAPSDIRGLFQPIATRVPGIEISELMPHVAEHADKIAVVRSVHHGHSQHNPGMYWSIVGRPYRIDSTLINPSRSDYPCFGTLVGWLAERDGYSGALPPYVITPQPHCDSLQYITPGQFGSCLGARFDPLVLNSDPNKKDFAVRGLKPVEHVGPERLRERRELLSNLGARGQRVFDERARDLEVNQAKAWSLISTTEAADAFDLSQEPAAVRERYGRHTWGQSHLLARRLVEAGVRFVTTVNGPSITWDTHKDNFNLLKKKLVPPMEQAYAALLGDLSERGLLDDTLVVWMGDFGRTPAINKDAGRDHWPQCYTVTLAGGGIRGGQVIGESDAQGAEPITRPVTPADIHATVFRALGYDPHAITYQTVDGRPVPLSEGQVIGELL